MFKSFHDSLISDRLLASGDRVLVALSGGPDSVALLFLLHASASLLNLNLHAAHLDHALRAESVEDTRFVAGLCSSLNIPLVVERCDIAEYARLNRQGLEEAGRDRRREFLLRTAGRLGCSAIALGHHRGDQAETVLHRLLRGTSLSGLAAMRPRSGAFIRPLLPFSRQQILEFLRNRHLEYREDASNRERRFTRNRIRLDLMPLLEEFNPRVEERLAGLAARIAREEDFWQGEVDKALEKVILEDRPCSASDGDIRLDRPGLLALHPALRARVLRRALGEVRGGLAGLSAVHLDAVENLVLSGPPQGEVHLPGGWVGRRYERVWLRADRPVADSLAEVVVDGPGEWTFAGRMRLRVLLLDEPRGESDRAVEFSAARVTFPLTLRTFRPGDRFRPRGGAGTGKLKKFFIDHKIDRETRQGIPLVATAEDILWIVGMRRCAGREASTASGRVLRLEVLPPE